MTDKTLGAYKRTTPDPDETTGEALARLQAEMTRLLDEADAELRDEADGGVAAALIEQEVEESDAAPEDVRQYLAERDERERLGRLVEQTREDGCPVQVDRVKITPCDTYGRTRDEVALLLQLDRAVADRDKARRERDSAREDRQELQERLAIQQEMAEKERDRLTTVLATTARQRDEADKRNAHPLSPDAITDEEVERARAEADAWGYQVSNVGMRHILTAASTEPPARPEWADLGEALDRLWPHGTDGIAREDIARRLHTEAGVRVVTEDGAR